MQNFEFKSIYDCLPLGVRGNGPHQFYDQFREEILEYYLKHGDSKLGKASPSIEHNRTFAELTWYECGKPFYRLSNDIVDLFSDVSLDIPFSFVTTPYPTFAILFETDNPLRGNHNRQVQSMLVQQCPDEEGVPTFNLWVDLGEKDPHADVLPLLNYLHMTMAPEGKTIQEAVREFPLDESGSDLPAGDLDYLLTRLAISVCFLATSSDKLIRPDILSKDLARWLQAARQGDETQMNVITERARRRKGLGYVVSLERERQLIHAIGRGGGESTGGHELHHSHMRAGHFRRLSKSGKVTFIRPTIVRPDLPSRA